MGKRITNIRYRYKKARNNLLAYRQANITLKQMPHLMREMRLWLRVTKNFREIEGSWTRALRRYMVMFQGRPRKQDRCRQDGRSNCAE